MFNPAKRRQRAAKWRDELKKHIYYETIPVEGWKTGSSDDPAAATAAFDDSGWKTIRAGAGMGPIDRFLWLRSTVTIPARFAGGQVIFRLDVGRRGELFGHTGLLFVDGVEAAGLDRMHKELVLARRARGGERFSAAARIYTGPVESFSILEFGDPRRILSGPVFNEAVLCLVNPSGMALYRDFFAAVDILESTPADSREEAELLAAISDAITVIDLDAEGKKRDASFRKAGNILKERVFSGRKGDAAGKVYLVGQSHIDMAWLWPRRETILKCAATMANTFSLQSLYPFYNFSHSQAQGFQWLKDNYPGLHARARRAARAGRLELVGGMWVEADLNCAGGEALARQFLYGQRFFEKEFGARSNVGWLVDTFGYNWSLPQILKESGIDYFVSTKPTWNDTNTFPFTTFWWEGPDGSRVLTHIPPLTYGHDIGAQKVISTLAKNREAWLGLSPLVLYGRSDGGGGPRIIDIESIKRLTQSPYVGEMEITTAGKWFESLPTDLPYPVYCDEMYVETHRGTYTSQARTKRNNRKAECALYAAEAAATFAAALGARYPKANLERAWKLALFNQFHDILPGSSIAPVYADAEKDYAEVFATTADVTQKALKFVAGKIDTTGRGKAFLVFNPLPWERTDVVEIETGPGRCRVVDCEELPVASQPVAGNKKRTAVLVTIPPCGWKIIRAIAGREPRVEPLAAINGRKIETEFFSLELNSSGQLSRIFDRHAGREVLAEGRAGNRLVLFEDIPVEYEAWDIDEWINEKTREVSRLESCEVIENGPVRTVLRLAWKTGSSTIVQRLALYGHTRRIDFETQVDWRERKKLLKAAFPLAVRARRATYEIAFAAIDRSTHQSNPWDWARFEVPAQKWADLSQADYGASILNDSKYGCDAAGDELRLSLLRSPEAPDPEADQGRHEFTYSLLPHRGDWRAGRTVEEALELNVPLLAEPVASAGGGLSPEGWFLKLEAEDGAPVVLSALKMAEDGRACVARIYEPHGRRAEVALHLPFEITRAARVNFLEDEQARLRCGKGRVTLELLPWKIATLKIALK